MISKAILIFTMNEEQKRIIDEAYHHHEGFGSRL
jgi:hypothetical protein